MQPGQPWLVPALAPLFDAIQTHHELVGSLLQRQLPLLSIHAGSSPVGSAVVDGNVYGPERHRRHDGGTQQYLQDIAMPLRKPRPTLAP
jgi:hypothetical protein